MMKELYKRIRAMRPGGNYKEYDKLFRLTLFGGYCREDVARYIQRLEEGLKDCEQEGTAQAEKNKKNDALIEEAIGRIQQLLEENERLLERAEKRKT